MIVLLRAIHPRIDADRPRRGCDQVSRIWRFDVPESGTTVGVASTRAPLVDCSATSVTTDWTDRAQPWNGRPVRTGVVQVAVAVFWVSWIISGFDT